MAEPRNAARRLFLEPGERERYGNWHDIAADTVAQLRLSAGRRPNDPRLTGLIGELAIRSSAFQLLWAMGDAGRNAQGPCSSGTPSRDRSTSTMNPSPCWRLRSTRC